jgi:capsular exopolysaccharide synthesis family protein
MMDKPDLITIINPNSAIAEAFRTLRTNIQFSSIDKTTQVVCVTSAGPGEGKSTVAANLAVVMAETGKKTLLIDCDLRKPTLHKTFSLSNSVGLSDLLAGKIVFEKAVQESGVDNLMVLTSGTKPPNPSELLASSKIKKFITALRTMFDFIIIDTPPVLLVTDPQLLAGYTDGYLLVLASAEVDKDAAVKAKDLLEKVNAKILGAVLNKFETASGGYYGYYGKTYYGDKNEK